MSDNNAERNERDFVPSKNISVLPEDVLKHEWGYIHRRRKKAGSVALPADSTTPSDDVSSDSNPDTAPRSPRGIIGLALSGGGLRSALFNSGLVQALIRKGFFKDADYLCTISGGGYFGGHLTALSHRKASEGTDKNSSPTITCDDLGIGPQQQLTENYRFRDVGQYLIQSVSRICAAIGGWLVGTIVTTSTVICGLGACAMLLALFWRMFDLEYSRRIIEYAGIPQLSLLLGLADETLIAFLPGLFVTLFVASGYTIWHLIAYLCYDMNDPDKFDVNYVGFSRRLRRVLAHTTFVGLSSFLVSLAVLSGNGEMQTNVFENNVDDYSMIQHRWTMPLLFTGLISSLPWYAIRFIGRSARQDAPGWQKAVLSLCVLFSATALPFFLVHWAARENISEVVTYREPSLLRNDVLNWASLVKISDSDLGVSLKDARFKDEQVSSKLVGNSELINVEQLNDLLDQDIDRWESYVPMLSRWMDVVRYFALDAKLMPGNGWLKPREKPSTELGQRLQRFDLGDHDRDTSVDIANKQLSSPDLTMRLLSRAYEQSPKNVIVEGTSGKSNGSTTGNTDGSKGPLEGVATSVEQGPLATKAVPIEGEVKKDPAKLKSNDSSQVDSVQRRSLELALASGGKLGTDAPQSLVNSLDADLRSQFRHGWRRISDEVNASEAASGSKSISNVLSNWTGLERQRFNRLLLEAIFPDIIRSKVMISTRIVPPADQLCRAKWLLLFSVAFGMLSCLNWNYFSPVFRYYRNHLAEAFIQTGLKDKKDVPLADLVNVQSAGPYPIMLAAAEFYRARTIQFGDRPHSEGSHVYAETTHPFTFTPYFCGSTSLGYARTKKYCQGRLTLSDAIAVSGAAFSPFIIHKAPIILLLSAFNLRLGMNLPNPKRITELLYTKFCNWQIPFIRTSASGAGLYEWFRSFCWPDSDWTSTFIDDGGFHEFLGLEELLLRRCRLIVVSDAGCNNGRFEFGVLADVLRKCRVKHGMEFLDLDHESPVDLTRLTRDEKTNTQLMSHVVFRVKYPKSQCPGSSEEVDEAIVVYAQMSLTPHLDLDLRQFRNVNPNFPDEPVFNQFFTKDQVESYRQLGYFIGSDILAMKDYEEESVHSQRTHRHQGDSRAEYWISEFCDSYLAVRNREEKKTGHVSDETRVLEDRDAVREAAPRLTEAQRPAKHHRRMIPSKSHDIYHREFQEIQKEVDHAVTVFLKRPDLRESILSRIGFVHTIDNASSSLTDRRPRKNLFWQRKPYRLVYLILGCHFFRRDVNRTDPNHVFDCTSRPRFVSEVSHFLVTERLIASGHSDQVFEGKLDLPTRLTRFAEALSDHVFEKEGLSTVGLVMAILSSSYRLIGKNLPLEFHASEIQRFLEECEWDSVTSCIAPGDNRTAARYE